MERGDSVAPATIAGVALTHPDRILYPGQGITKRALAEYYGVIAEAILPHLVGRPLTLLRCPRGASEPCFYQRHWRRWIPETAHIVRERRGHEELEHLTIEDRAGLIGLVQAGVLEVHAWNARMPALDRPDRLIFDLDPGEGIAWSEIVVGAREVRHALQLRGLKSWVKTTGGRGLHVVVPLVPRANWESLRAFARGVAEELARQSPQYVLTLRKTARRNKILIDYARNARSATVVAAYSPRAREGAPVAVPIGWEELDDPEIRRLTIHSVPGRLAALRQDPWEQLWRTPQVLPKADA